MTDPAPKPPRFSKRASFLLILLGAAGVAGLISLVAYTLLDRKAGQEITLAVIAPLSGPGQALGRSIQRGVELFVAQTNQAGGVGGQPLRLVAFDDGDDPVKARAAAEQAAAGGAIGVIGHWSDAAATAASEVYQARELPAVTAAGDLHAADLPADPWLFRNSFDRIFEIRFLANYVRNVIGEKTVSIVLPTGAQGDALATAFDTVLQRFGTKVVYRWDYDPDAPNAALDERMRAVALDITEKKLIGAILVLGDPLDSARVVARLREGGVRNRIVGPRTLATTAFTAALAQTWTGKGSLDSALNGALVTTPLLFDTAGELAQGFRNSYINTHRVTPDWLAASAFDGARLLIHGLGKPTGAPRSVTEMRQQIKREISAHAGKSEIYQGLMGPVTLDARGVAAPTALVGTYDGVDLVAALTQLSPIREENVGNYLDELVAGRALYVNDRFMYKTNVVYAGLKLEKIGVLSRNATTAELEFTIWFRWRGPIEPQDLVFTNAAEAIRLDKPDREMKIGDMTYRSYRVKGKFFLNYTAVERAYDTEVVGVAFRHRSLNRNNLMYVSDILGMDLNSRQTLAEQLTQSKLMDTVESSVGDASLLHRLAELVPGGQTSADPLVQSMQQSRVLAGVSGWVLDRAWISQQVARRGAEGDPAFVGFGKPAPEFSQLDMGSILKPDQINARDIVPKHFFPAIAIFGLVGATLAHLLDRKDRGQFWRMQTLGLRLVTWPLLLIAGGNLALDYALDNLSSTSIDTILTVYSALWWLIPAQLMAISVERFIWVPLEIKASRKIPNIIRMVVALIIYLFAVFGVVAFVLGQTITSLLATSGLMAMIIGLAIQANIANVFSGIVLNIERPFKVGDYIKISAAVMGEVIDITWRTTRIRHLEGQLVCLANAKISELEIHNYSDLGPNFVRLQLYVDPKYDPRLISRLVKEALDSFDIFQNLGSNYFGPNAQFKGVECVNGFWAARYRVKFYLMKGNDENMVVHELWARIWERFQANGVEWAPPETEPALPAKPAPMITVSDHKTLAPAGAA